MMTAAEFAMLALVAVLGHAMALFWTAAGERQWRIARRTIYDLPIPPEQLQREKRNSLHTPMHALMLLAFLLLGCFRERSAASFFGSLVATALWAEIWHYASHRAFHLKRLHWIHTEHHKSRLNSPYTAISFSFTEKLLFNLGILGVLALADRLVGLNFYGIAAWYAGYLVINSFSHANFEIKGEHYNRRLGKLLTSTTYHALHHSRYRGNYGLGTRVLDRLFGTEWDDYASVYDRVSRREPLAKLSEKIGTAHVHRPR